MTFRIYYDIFHVNVAPGFFVVLNIPVMNKIQEFKEDTNQTTNYIALNTEAVNQFQL